MTAEISGNCAICQDTWDDVASALPCGHKFCQVCILQWAQINPVCPLCRRTIDTIRFSDSTDKPLEIVITAPEQLPAATSQAGRAPGGQDENSSHPLVLPHPSSPQETPPRAVGGVLPEVWARLFRRQRELLDPVRTWLRQRTETVCGELWWLAESCILYMLCVHGPHQEIMIEGLQSVLEEHTVPLIQDTIDIIVRHCSSGAQRLLRSSAAADENDSPAASSRSSSSSCSSSSSSSNNLSSSSSSSQMGTPASSSSPAVSMEKEEEAATGAAAQPRGHRHPPSVSMSAGQDRHQQEPEQEVMLAGSSAQSCRPRSPDPQHPPKKRAPEPQDSPPTCKRSSHQQN